MYYSQTTDWKSPTAHIAVNRNRMKHYDNKVYLKNGTHFEIELFNPKSISVLAEILIDGKAISKSGIVVKPGQRVFLERWIDTPKKFLFETYLVEENEVTVEAIKENGKVKVKFYDEITIHPSISTAPYTTYTSYPTWINDNLVYGSQPTYRFATANISTSLSFTSTNAAGSMETGRTEKGEASSQQFSQANTNFVNWVGTTVNIQIFPEDLKTIEAGEIRNYCSECGTRIKKSNWKFCPSCGTKL
jgi:hypothetical protein